jgi:hypothetical protein
MAVGGRDVPVVLAAIGQRARVTGRDDCNEKHERLAVRSASSRSMGDPLDEDDLSDLRVARCPRGRGAERGQIKEVGSRRWTQLLG